MSSDSEIFALIGRIHVLMRRSLNRITDVDYMKENKEYARAIVALAEGSGQEELAQLLGASRQRVNQELKAMEREQAIRIEPGGLVVRDSAALLGIAGAAA